LVLVFGKKNVEQTGYELVDNTCHEITYVAALSMETLMANDCLQNMAVPAKLVQENWVQY
jgi:hypothetical protein